MGQDSVVFFITQIGEKLSPIRKRADDVAEFIIGPALADVAGRGLEVGRLLRADHEVTPGSITVQIVRAIADAQVVIADLTGRNPNVYYELALAHAFGQRVVVLVDNVSHLAFDMKDARVIEIGDEGAIPAREAQAAAASLADTLEAVLAPDYTPESLVEQAQRSRQLRELSADGGDPVPAQLAELAETLEELRSEVRSSARTGRLHPSAGYPVEPGEPIPGVGEVMRLLNIRPQYSRGQIINHEKFGLGQVLDVHGEGDHKTLIVEFVDGGTTRELLTAYAPITIVESVPETSSPGEVVDTHGSMGDIP